MLLIVKIAEKMKPKDPEAFCESLFDNAFDGLAYCQMIFDAERHPVDFTYIRVNKNFEKLMKLKEVEGKKATILIPGIHVSNPDLFEICGQVSLTGRSKRFEVYIGPLARWFLVSVYSPEKEFFVAIFQDITDRKQIEKDLENAKVAAANVLQDLQVEAKTLAHAKAKDEALLESIGEGVVATDQDGNMIVMNKVAEDFLRFTSREMIGKPFAEAVALEDTAGNQVQQALQPITLALALRTTTTTTDYYFVRKDGTKFPVAITATPVLLEGKPTGAIVVFRDITKEKEIEKLRTDFLALASHQLRTPLSGTKWLIETIQRGILGDLNLRQKEYLNNLYQINERMIGLVSDMLNVLMLESGARQIKKQEIPVTRIYKELLLMMEPASRNKGVTLRDASKDHETSFVRSDPQALRSILENLVGNAINYSQDGQEVVLDVKEEPDTVVFSVKDTGIGIPKEEQKRIFERFYRASNAKESRPDGTGLGLYTALLLAQKVGGKISFDSEENRGTTFYLRVPKAVDARGKKL